MKKKKGDFRVRDLESELDQQKRVRLDLSTENSNLKALLNTAESKWEYLEKENQKLQSENDIQQTQMGILRERLEEEMVENEQLKHHIQQHLHEIDTIKHRHTLVL